MKTPMKQAFFALQGGDWEEYKSIFRTEVKATEWALDRTKENEAFEKGGEVRQES